MHFSGNMVSLWPSLDMADTWHDMEPSWTPFYPIKVKKFESIRGQRASTFLHLWWNLRCRVWGYGRWLRNPMWVLVEGHKTLFHRLQRVTLVLIPFFFFSLLVFLLGLRWAHLDAMWLPHVHHVSIFGWEIGRIPSIKYKKSKVQLLGDWNESPVTWQYHLSWVTTCGTYLNKWSYDELRYGIHLSQWCCKFWERRNIKGFLYNSSLKDMLTTELPVDNLFRWFDCLSKKQIMSELEDFLS